MTSGQKAEQKNPELAVTTGFPDDRRIELPSSHQLYGLAEHARAHQTQWSDDEHRSFWSGALPLWPRRGRPSIADRLGEVAAYLADVVMLDESEIADVLGYELETLRRRPYVERGQEIGIRTWEDNLGDPDDPLCDSRDGWLRGPWVFSTVEPDPMWVRPALEPTVGPSPDASVDAAQARALEHQRAMWANGEFVYVNDMICRVVNGHPDVTRSYAAVRRLLMHGGKTTDYVEDVIAFAKAEGKYPPEPAAS